MGAGDPLTYTLTIRNNGPFGATNTTVTNTLPAPVTFTAAMPSQGTCGTPVGSSLTCNLGLIANGGTATITINVDVLDSATGIITNIAAVDADQPDPNTSNNTLPEVTSILQSVTPTVTGLSPPDISAGAAEFILTINGSNFPNNPTVRWIDPVEGECPVSVLPSNAAQVPVRVQQQCIDFDITVDRQIQVVVGSGACILPGGPSQPNCAAFTLHPALAPTIQALIPPTTPNGTNGPDLTLDIRGSNYIRRTTDGSRVLVWLGSESSPTPANTLAQLTPLTITPTQILVTVGAQNLMLADPNVDETRKIAILNPGTAGKLSNISNLTVTSTEAPSIDPSAPFTPTGGCSDSTDTTVLIRGTNFRPTQSGLNGSLVEFGSLTLTPVRVTGGQLVEVIVPAGVFAVSQTTVVPVIVRNPDGQLSAASDFVIAGPTLNVGNPLVPASVVQRTGQFSLQANGNCFAVGSTIRWNGQSLATTRNSLTLATATVQAERVLEPGEAMVTIVNPSGAESQPATFTILGDGTPPVISDFQVVASSITATSATVTFNTDEPAKGKAFFGPDPSQFMETPLGTTFLTSHVVEIFGLTAGTSYFVQAAALDAGELEGRSQTLTFTTLDDQGPTFTSPVDILGITETSAILVFTTNEEASSTVFFGTNPSSLQSIDTPGRFTDHFVPLAGLTPGSTYFVRVEIEDASGNATTGSFLTFDTLDNTGPGITNARHQILSQSTVNVLWNTTEPATTQVEFGLTTELGQMTAIDPSLVTSHSVLLTGLDPESVYFYRARSEDALGNGSFSSVGTFIIQLDPIPTITFNSVPAMTDPARQPTLQLLLGEPYPLDISGTLILDFTDSAENPGNDETIKFSRNGLREILFSIPANRTRAEFEGEGSRTTVRYSTGTVAGTISLEIPNLEVLNNDLTPNPVPSTSTTIQRLPPVIRTMTVENVSDAGFDVVVVGYSTPREMEALRFRFTARDESTVINIENDTFQVGDLFDAWYQDPASEEVGSQFTLTIPFQIGGGVSLLEGIFVTAINGEGESAEVGAAIPLPPPPM